MDQCWSLFLVYSKHLITLGLVLYLCNTSGVPHGAVLGPLIIGNQQPLGNVKVGFSLCLYSSTRGKGRQLGVFDVVKVQVKESV